jgi:hypothetical protein
MIARWRGQTVRVFGTKGDRTQISTRRGLRWVPTSELELI